jgi:hypothetical protein
MDFISCERNQLVREDKIMRFEKNALKESANAMKEKDIN